MSSYTWPGDLREVTGLGGAIEISARAAVSEGARWIDAHEESRVLHFVFDRDDNCTRRAASRDAQDLLYIIEDAAAAAGIDLDDTTREGVLRQLQIYWALQDAPGRWERYLLTRRVVDGVCRYCGDRLNPELDGWVERSTCVRCANSRSACEVLRRAGAIG